MDTEIAVQRALTDVDREVRVWLGDNDPLARAELDEVASAFKRTVGETADDRGGAPWLRIADPVELGTFVARHDAVIYEFDDESGVGGVVGYPAGERRWVPVVLCAPAPATEAATLVGSFLEAAGEATDGEVARP